MANPAWWWSRLACEVSVTAHLPPVCALLEQGSRVRASSETVFQLLALPGRGAQGNRMVKCSWQLSMLIRARCIASLLLMLMSATSMSPHLMLVAPCQRRAATFARECQSVPSRTAPSRFWIPPALNLQLRGGAQEDRENTRPQDAGVNVVPWDVVTGPGRFRYVCNNALSSFCLARAIEIFLT
jgi:hypothetical protein